DHLLLHLERHPGAALAVIGRAGRIDRLYVEIAHRRDVIGEAPGDLPVAAQVDPWPAGIRSSGNVERAIGERELRLEPLPRLREGIVGVAAQHRIPGGGAPAGDRPVVAAVAIAGRAGRAAARPLGLLGPWLLPLAIAGRAGRAAARPLIAR